jgi:hypothetical protein
MAGFGRQMDARGSNWTLLYSSFASSIPGTELDRTSASWFRVAGRSLKDDAKAGIDWQEPCGRKKSGNSTALVPLKPKNLNGHYPDENEA